MRRRGIGILVSLIALGLALVARPAAAQTPSSDGEAVGELLGGDGAGVVTSHEQFQPEENITATIERFATAVAELDTYATLDLS